MEVDEVIEENRGVKVNLILMIFVYFSSQNLTKNKKLFSNVFQNEVHQSVCPAKAAVWPASV